MTPAPPLPDLLAALAQRVPERVQYLPAEAVARVKLWGCWQRVYLDETGDIVTHAGASYLELSAREEIKSRGWHAAYVPTIDGQRLAVTIYRNGSAETLGMAWGDTHAEALALALVQALEGEG